MATKLGFFKLTALPATGVADSLYFIEGAGGNDAEMYITDNAGAYHNLGNTPFVTAIAQAVVNQALAAQQNVVVYPDIAARDADQANLTTNTLIVVKDASGDPTVDVGAALYIYEDGPDTYSKLSEFESLDLTLNWADIQNGPTSSPAQIDDAVGLRHSHANKAALDRLGVDADNCLTIDGAGAQIGWNGNDW